MSCVWSCLILVISLHWYHSTDCGEGWREALNAWGTEAPGGLLRARCHGHRDNVYVASARSECFSHTVTSGRSLNSSTAVLRQPDDLLNSTSHKSSLLVIRTKREHWFEGPLASRMSSFWEHLFYQTGVFFCRSVVHHVEPDASWLQMVFDGFHQRG